MQDFSHFVQVQTRTAWAKTLGDFADWCAPETGSVILDVGSGPGLLPALFSTRSGVQAIGCDIAIPSARLHPQLVAASAYDLPFAPHTFDMITTTNVLFLLGDPGRALRAMRRALKTGGQLCLLNPSEHLSVQAAEELATARGLVGENRASLLGWARNAETHVRWREAQLAALLKSNGFTPREFALRVGPGFARLCRATVT